MEAPGRGARARPGWGPLRRARDHKPGIERGGVYTRGELGTEGKAAEPQRRGARGYAPREWGATWKVQDGSHEESPDGGHAVLPGCSRATVVPVSGRTGSSGRSAPGGSPRVHSGGVVTRLRSPRGMGLHGGARHSTGIVPGGSRISRVRAGWRDKLPTTGGERRGGRDPGYGGQRRAHKEDPPTLYGTGGHVTARARGLRGEPGSA